MKEPSDNTEKTSTAAACSLAMQRIIKASRYERSDVADYIGLSVQTLDKRMRGITSFLLEEALMICKFLDVDLSDALKFADMTKDEFENAWIYQWRRQNFTKHVGHLVASTKMTHAEIADKCGFSQAWLSRVLKGANKLSGRNSRIVEQRLGIEPDWLDRKPMTPPSSQQINTDLIVKTSTQLMGSVKQAGFEVDSDLLSTHLTATVQLYNARIAMKDGYDPDTDAAQFQVIFNQLTMQLKMKEGLWKH